MKEESLLLLSDLQKLINQVVLIDYTIIILGGGKYVVVYWWWNHNLCVRYVYLLKAGLNMEINRRMEILLCR